MVILVFFSPHVSQGLSEVLVLWSKSAVFYTSLLFMSPALKCIALLILKLLLQCLNAAVSPTLR